MGTRQGTVDFLLRQMAGAVSARKMFGEYALYCEGKLVALVCDDQLFLKPTAAGRRLLGTPEEQPPYPSAKPCFVVGEDFWDDGPCSLPSSGQRRPNCRPPSKSRAGAPGHRPDPAPLDRAGNSTRRGTCSKNPPLLGETPNLRQPLPSLCNAAPGARRTRP